MDSLFKKSILLILILLFVIITVSPISVSSSGSNTDSSSVSLVFGLILMLFIVMVILATLVYFDAKKRGEKGGLWLTVIFLSNFVGLAIWLFVRPPEGQQKKNHVDFNNRNFDYKRNYINPHSRVCPKCSRPIPFDAVFCPYCGKHFKNYL